MIEIKETCLSCNKEFVPTPMHPAVTSAWCDDCLRTLHERTEIVGYVANERTMRAEDV